MWEEPGRGLQAPAKGPLEAGSSAGRGPVRWHPDPPVTEDSQALLWLSLMLIVMPLGQVCFFTSRDEANKGQVQCSQPVGCNPHGG